MLKTVLTIIAQIIISLPIIYSLFDALFLLSGRNKNMFMQFFLGFITNLVLFGVILVSAILVVSKNKNLTKKSIAIFISIALVCLALHFLGGYALIEVYKNTNLFD